MEKCECQKIERPVITWTRKDFEELRNGTIGNIDWEMVAHKVEDMISRKPEPEQPVIRKSGGTWVAKTIHGDSFYNGYSETEPERTDQKWRMISDSDGKQLIEITDEIAKLRPMVIFSDRSIGKLIHIDNGTKAAWVIEQIENNAKIYDIDGLALATVSDLLEEN